MLEYLSSLYGDLPPLRMDSPLTALNFRLSDAVVIVHGSIASSNGPITDYEFSKIQTVRDLATALGHVEPRNVSRDNGSI